MFCSKCGSQIDSNSRFCEKCGTRTEQEACSPDVQQSYAAHANPFHALSIRNVAIAAAVILLVVIQAQL